METYQNSLDGLLARINDRPTILSYKQVERDVQVLAADLLDAFGQSAVHSFQYSAIPRGGGFVLSILSYILDLSPGQLGWNEGDSVPLIVVDDCSLSGARFAQYLAEVPKRPIIFASLYAHPALRKAILENEPDVLNCISARDLTDLAPQLYPTPEAYKSWRQRWETRSKGKHYWIGLPEMVIFPWNEPDRLAWNPETNQVENNWRLASPDRCLKNWALLGMPPRADVKAAVRIPDPVAFSLQENDISLYNSRDDMVYGLSGVSADIWRGLAAYGDLSATRAHLLTRYEVDEARLTADIQSLVDTLFANGLLEAVDEATDA